MKSKFAIPVLMLLLFPGILAAQGYYNRENFGNRSLLLSGNVTGSVEDLGLTYYNPARIALVEAPSFSINAKAYQVSSLSLKNAFGRDEKLRDSRFEGVPSLLAGTFNIDKWEKHHFAYAFLSKQRQRLSISAENNVSEGDLIDDNQGLESLVSRLDLDNSETDEWFGLTWGMKLRENLSIGVSAFASVYNFRAKYDLRLAGLEENQDVKFYNNLVNFGQTSYGMFWKVGLAWKVKDLDLGINLDLPYLEVINDGKFSQSRFLSGYGEGDDVYSYGNLKGIDSKRKVPFSVSFGAGIPWKKNKFHLKVDWHGSVSEYDRLVIPSFENGSGEIEEFSFKEALRSIINFGVGGEFFLSEKVDLFASFSTDYSPLKSNASIFDLIGDGETDININADFMHYGMGVDLKFKRARITVGGTYSHGSGNFMRPGYFPAPDEDEFSGNENTATVSVSRWRVIVGLEFPIFGYEVNIK
jgi:hypothetical protein